MPLIMGLVPYLYLPDTARIACFAQSISFLVRSISLTLWAMRVRGPGIVVVQRRNRLRDFGNVIGYAWRLLILWMVLLRALHSCSRRLDSFLDLGGGDCGSMLIGIVRLLIGCRGRRI